MKVRLLIIYSLVYSITLVVFTIYWATNFTRHTFMKGDEFSMLAEFLFIFTYILYLIIQFTVQRINFLFALLIPIVTAIAAFCIGLLILLVTQLSGVPRQYIWIYSILYGMFTLFSVYRFWGRPFKTK
jgi:hypothetical protein